MIAKVLKSLNYLVYPKLCLSCMEEAALDTELFCIKCIYHLPESDMHIRRENQFTNRLIGIEGIQTGSAYYLYYESSPVSDIIHRIKYKGRKDIAKELGKAFGKKLKQNPLYSEIDFLVPIPLHKKRLRKRGFNQSKSICEGLSHSLELPIEADNLIRTVDTQTQTKLSKAERQKNLKDAFKVVNPEALKGKHILLVDDVLTTGSTIEECTGELRKRTEVKISVVTLAIRVY